MGVGRLERAPLAQPVPVAEPNSGGATTAIVALVAVAVIALLVYLFVVRGGAPAEGGGTDIDVNVGDPVEAATE